MTQVEEKVVEIVKKLIPEFKKLEFRASIGDTSRSVEFFVWLGDQKRQCYELADNGEIDEEKMEALFASFADFVRKSEGYKKGEVNKVSLTI